jgi:fluoride exporter
MTLLWIAIAGAIGSVGRYLVSLWMLDRFSQPMWGTLTVNFVGSFLIGFLMVLTVNESSKFIAGPEMRAGLTIGFCGGFTTFSTFSQQTLALFEKGDTLLAMLNVGLSVSLCLLGVFLGWVVARTVNGGAPIA